MKEFHRPKISVQWRALAENRALRCRQLFEGENVQVVLAADETFLKFHESDQNLIVPVGVKRVGVASNKDIKNGCKVMVTMEMASSQLT